MSEMYYHRDDISQNLKCSYCSIKFKDRVKILAPCGNSICGACYDRLKSSLNKSRHFKCKACRNVRHIMPRGGLITNHAILRMLKVKPVERPLSVKAKSLKSAIRLISKEFDSLVAFDDTFELNAYYDGLRKQIVATADASIKEIYRMQDELLAEVDQHRRELVAEAARPPKGFLNDQAAVAQSEIDKLSGDFKDFKAKWRRYFDQDSGIGDAEIENAQFEANEFQARLAEARDKLKRATIEHRMLTFLPNCLFHQPIGTLEGDSLSRSGIEVVHYSHNNDYGCEPQFNSLVGHTGFVRRVVFLDDEKLASCSDDLSVKIWNLSSAQMLFELLGHTKLILAMEYLPRGYLATGSSDTSIKIWDLLKRRIFRTLAGHTDCVFSLKEVQDGRLVSCSLDNTIKIWNPLAGDSEAELIQTIEGHGNTRGDIQLDLMSSSFLVTCSNSLDDFDCDLSTIRIWNLKRGSCIKSVSTGQLFASCLVVLRENCVAVGFTNGSIKIINTKDTRDSLLITGCHVNGVWSLAQFNGYVLSTGSKDTEIKIWSSSDGRLVQTIQTGHTGDINSITFSQDGRQMATASDDSTIRLLPVDVESMFN